MKVRFTPNAEFPQYRINNGGETLAFLKAGVFDLPEDVARMLVQKRPALFALDGVSDPGGNLKSVEAPAHNRMFSRPKRNK